MRIISGKAKGTKLFTLEGYETRPTLERAKEALFNIIGNNIIESNFLDLFSGSGQIGLEAASRGARKVILSEKSKKAANIINKNIKKTHMESIVELNIIDYEDEIKTIKEEQDFIFIDPPFRANLYLEILKKLLENKIIIGKNTTIIIETENSQEIEDQIKKISEFKIKSKRKYGRIEFIFIKKLEEVKN